MSAAWAPAWPSPTRRFPRPAADTGFVGARTGGGGVREDRGAGIAMRIGGRTLVWVEDTMTYWQERAVVAPLRSVSDHFSMTLAVLACFRDARSGV